MNRWALLVLAFASATAWGQQTCNRSSEACLTWNAPRFYTPCDETQPVSATNCANPIPAGTVINYTVYKSRDAATLGAEIAGITTTRQLKVINLQTGMWYFAVTARIGDNTSALSNVGSKNLLPRLGKPVTLEQPVILPPE